MPARWIQNIKYVGTSYTHWWLSNEQYHSISHRRLWSSENLVMLLSVSLPLTQIFCHFWYKLTPTAYTNQGPQIILRNIGSLTTLCTPVLPSPRHQASQADPGLQYAGPVLSRVVPRDLTSISCSVIKLSSLSHSNQSPSFDSGSSCHYSRRLLNHNCVCFFYQSIYLSFVDKLASLYNWHISLNIIWEFNI